jgi:hypothetical protein
VAELPAGFPSKLSDDDLAAAIDEWIAEYREIWPTSKLPELSLAFVNSGLQEQSRREVAASAQSAARAAQFVVGIAGLTLLVAVVTLIVAIAK